MGMGCPHCRVIGGPHDDGCPWHPSADAAREECEEEMGELRRTIETLETRITELESEIGRHELRTEEYKERIDRATLKITVGIGLAVDLIKRHFEEMDDAGAQLARLREWAGYPEHETDGN